MNIRRSLLAAGLLGCLLAVFGGPDAHADELGIDLGGSAGDYVILNSDNWTLGYEFTLDSTRTVSGLGFWDRGDGYNATQVGLWRTDGTLIASVNSANDTVSSFATANGHGTWNFMDTSVTLGAGTYVVGSWGRGMEYTYSDTQPLIEATGLTHDTSRERSGGIFQFPSNAFFQGNGIYGGNVQLDVVPEPGSIALLGLGLVGVGVLRRRRKRA